MSLALCFAQHVSNASTFIFRSLRLCVGILLCKPTTKHSSLIKDANAKSLYPYRPVYPHTVSSSWSWMY